AGKGTRMKSARAKVLHPLLGLPLLEHVRRAVAAAGADPVTVVVGHLADDVPLLRGETLRELLAHHTKSGAQATVLTTTLDDPGAYGRVLRDGEGRVQAIVEAKDASPEVRAVREVNSGIYAFSVPALLSVLDRLQPTNA